MADPIDDDGELIQDAEAGDIIAELLDALIAAKTAAEETP